MKKIILMGVPHHNNLGDNAIALAEQKFIEDNFKQYQYYEIAEETLENCVDKIKKYVNDEDIIFLHGGGNFGDEYLYVEEGRRKVIQLFPNNCIILFPQTIYFSNTKKGQEELKKSIDIYSKHSKLTLIAREEKSFEIMKQYFTQNRILLTPDIVTYLNETKPGEKREGALFILRNDIETKLKKEDIQEVERVVRKYVKKIDYGDTARGKAILTKDREEKLENLFSKYRKAQLVITDRLHGMIFAAITSTPCIAFSNYNHKVEESSKYLKRLKYIQYMKDCTGIEEKINYLLGTKFESYNNDFAIQELSKIKEGVR